MTSTKLMGSLVTTLISEFEDDHVGLWTIVKQVRRAFPDDPPEEIRTKTLSLVLFLLQMGDIAAGFPTMDGRGFESWQIKPRRVVSRIASRWKNSTIDPGIGEIVWFTTSEPKIGDLPS